MRKVLVARQYLHDAARKHCILTPRVTETDGEDPNKSACGPAGIAVAEKVQVRYRGLIGGRERALTYPKTCGRVQ